MRHIFVRGPNVLGRNAQHAGKMLDKTRRGTEPQTIIVINIGDQARIVPNGDTIAPPVTTQSPARQGFARIPLALSVVQHGAGCKTVPQPLDEYL